MRVMTVGESYEELALGRESNRWFLRSDLLAWPQRAWMTAALKGSWTIVAHNDAVAFGIRIVDSYRRCIEVSLAQVNASNYERALEYAADYWNAASTVCWLPRDEYELEFAAERPPALVIQNFFGPSIGNSTDAILLTSTRKDNHEYLSIS